jgi:hypothetical protein
MNEIENTFLAMKKIFKYISLFLIILSCLNSVTAQDDEPTDIYLEFSTWKYNDMSRSLLAKITADNDEGEYFVEGLTVKYYVLGEEEILLGEAITGEKGIAELNIPDGSYTWPMDEEGYIQFYARFEENELFWEAEEELMIKDVFVGITFEEEDEERLVYFEGTVMMPEGEIPLADDDFYFYVPRMFSDMKIAEGWFEEDGTGYIEFPQGIIGDSVGNVLVIGRIDEHFDYGYVEVSGEINWAVPKRLLTAEGPLRELWTPIAPLWMIITLIILLAGVWGHYLYAIIQLVMIKRSRNKEI